MSSKVGAAKMTKGGKKKRKQKEPLSERERWAWINYDIASSPFFQVGTGIFFPFLFLDITREAACPYALMGDNGFLDTITSAQMGGMLPSYANTWRRSASGTFTDAFVANYPIGNHFDDSLYNITWDTSQIYDRIQGKGYEVDIDSDGQISKYNPGVNGPKFAPKLNQYRRPYILHYAIIKEADMPCVHHYCKDALLGQVAWSPYFNFTLNSTNLPADFNINMTFSDPDTYDPMCGETTLNKRNTGGHELYFDPIRGKGSVRFKGCRWRWGVQNATLSITTPNATLAKTEVLVYSSQNTLCYEKVPGVWTLWFQNELSFGPYCTFASVFCQLFLFISCASIADFGNYRLPIMTGASNISAGLTFSYMFSCWVSGVGTASTYWIAGLQFLMANTLFGLANVMYNAMLPVLTKDHPAVQEMISKKASPKQIVEMFKRQMQDMNDTGSGTGYLSGTGVLLFSAIPYVMLPQYGFNYMQTYGVVLGITGFYWLSLQQYTFCNLKPRPGPPLPGAEGSILGIDYIVFSVERTFTSMSNLALLPHSAKFALAFFFYSDVYNTIANVGVNWFTRELGVGLVEMLAMGILIPFCCMGAVFFWNYVINNHGYTPLQSIVTLMALMTTGTLYCCIGLIPGVPVGLKSSFELWLFAPFYGMCLGPLQAISRTCFAELIPPGHETEFFGILEISDKGSSFIGPLVTSILWSNFPDQINLAWVYLFVMSGIAMSLLVSIDQKIAARDATSLKMAMRLRKLKASRAHRKGIESFLSINQMSSAISSTFSGAGASSMLSSGLSELSQMSSVSSSVIGKSSISEIESTAESGVESAMESTLEDDGMEEDIESVIEDEEEELVDEMDLVRMEAQADEAEDENVKKALELQIKITKAEIAASEVAPE